MKTEFDFSRPRQAFLVYTQTQDKASGVELAASVAFVLDTADEFVKEEALTAEAESHKDWRLVSTRKNERILEFVGVTGRVKTIFAVPTTIYRTKEK